MQHKTMDATSLEKDGKMCATWGFRHIVIFMTFLGYIYFNITRVTLSVALIAMVNSTRSVTIEQSHNDSACAELPRLDSQNQSVFSTEVPNGNHSIIDSKLGEQFEWDLKTQSFQLSALFYGNVASQLLGGVLTQRYGIRWVFGIAGVVSSVLTLATPASAHWDALAIVVIRIIQGIAQGPMFPVRNQAVSYWMPVTERSSAFAFISVGLQVGLTVGMFLSGILSESAALGGWPSIFYVFGTFGVIWSLVWIALIADSPQQHPWVSHREIQKVVGTGQNKLSKRTGVPWCDILKSVPFWAYNLTLIGHGVAASILTTQIPMYLNKALQFNITSSGTLAATTILLQAMISFAGGYLADILRGSGRLSITTIRKVMTALGLMGSGLCLMGIGLAGCHLDLVLGLLYASFGLEGFVYPGCLIVAVDMSPSFSAILNGLSSTIGFFGSALVPYIVTVLVSSEQAMGDWSIVFMIFASVLIFTGLQFVLFGNAERQPWDSPKPPDSVGQIDAACAVPCAEKQRENTRF